MGNQEGFLGVDPEKPNTRWCQSLRGGRTEETTGLVGMEGNRQFSLGRGQVEGCLDI